MRPSALKIHAALFTVALIYASTPTLAKFLMPAYIQPIGLILVRITGALVIMYLYHAMKVKERIRSGRDYLLLAICALFGVGVNMVFFFEGVTRTSPINALLIMVTTPIIVLMIGFFLRLEKITLLKVLGISIGTAGAMLLISGTGTSTREGDLLGDIFVLINAIAYGIYLVMVKPLVRRYHPMTIMVWTFVFGAVFVMPFGFGQLMEARWADFGLPLWLDIIYIVIATTFFTYTLNGWSLRYANPSLVGSYIYLQPVLGTVIALLTGKYSLHWTQVAYAALIFAGVYMVSRKESRLRLFYKPQPEQVS